MQEVRYLLEYVTNRRKYQISHQENFHGIQKIISTKIALPCVLHSFLSIHWWEGSSNIYPGLQSHLKLPIVLIHFPCWHIPYERQRYGLEFTLTAWTFLYKFVTIWNYYNIDQKNFFDTLSPYFENQLKNSTGNSWNYRNHTRH